MKLLKTKTKNINNQKVYQEIDDFMMEVFATLSIYWQDPEHRDQLVEMMDMWMEQYALESGKIIQYDIRCTAPTKKRINFILSFRQRNCYNTSEITYIFEA